VLAAGAGTRLLPLTRLRPKALCPVGGVALVDRALDPLRRAGLDLAVNVHHGRPQLEAHVTDDVHLSIEAERVLGTAGALAHLSGWLDGRGAVVVNADTVAAPDVGALLEGWGGQTTRLLLAGGGELEPTSGLVASVVPWDRIRALEAEPSGLFEHVFRPAQEAGELEIVAYDGSYVDCGTPWRYLEANLSVSGGESVIGEGAVVEGSIHQCVIWPGTRVHPDERLSRVIRAGPRMTVAVRAPGAAGPEWSARH